ncbi:tyrosine-type recombinase/integrase, partial [Kibdelosporangium lantanae]
GAEDITPHSTRATGATILSATGATILSATGTPIERIQDRLGHRDIRTTRAYIQALHKIDTSAAHDLETLLAP